MVYPTLRPPGQVGYLPLQSGGIPYPPLVRSGTLTPQSGIYPTHFLWHLVDITRDPFKLIHLIPTTTDILWWLLKHVRLTRGRYVSYWNAFWIILESKKLFKLIVWDSFANLVVRKQGITPKQFHRFLYGKKYGGFASSTPTSDWWESGRRH